MRANLKHPPRLFSALVVLVTCLIVGLFFKDDYKIFVIMGVFCFAVVMFGVHNKRDR